jgi:hypothetical protein
MKKVLMIAIAFIFILSSPGYCYTWPESAPEDSQTTIIKRNGKDHFTIKAWREFGDVFIEIDPIIDVFDMYLYYGNFFIVQDGIQYDDVCIVTSSDYRNCEISYIDEKNIYRIGFIKDGIQWDEKASYKLYYNTDYENYITIDDAITYNVTVEIDPPNGGQLKTDFPEKYEANEYVYFAIDTNYGYKISHWNDNYDDSSYIIDFTMPAKDVDVVVYLESTLTDSDSKPSCFINSLR